MFKVGERVVPVCSISNLIGKTMYFNKVATIVEIDLNRMFPYFIKFDNKDDNSRLSNYEYNQYTWCNAELKPYKYINKRI